MRVALKFKLVNNGAYSAKKAIEAFVQLYPPKKEIAEKLKEWADVAEVHEYDTAFPKGKVKVVFLRDVVFDKFVGNIGKAEDQKISAITVRGHVVMPESLQSREKGSALTRSLNHEYWHARSRLPSTVDFERRIGWFKPSEEITLNVVSKRVAEELIAFIATGTAHEKAKNLLKSAYSECYTQINPKYFKKHGDKYPQIVDEMAALIISLSGKKVQFEKIQESIEEGEYPYSNLKKQAE